MTLILFIGIIVIIIAFIYRLISYLKFRSQLEKRKFDMIKLKGYSNNTWLHFIAGLVAIGNGFLSYKIHNLDVVLIFWFILGILSIIHCFISPHDYLLLNSDGLSDSYDKKMIEWEKITDINLISFNNQEFSIITDKKSFIINYGEKNFLDKILKLIKEKRVDIYNKFFSDFK